MNRLSFPFILEEILFLETMKRLMKKILEGTVKTIEAIWIYFPFKGSSETISLTQLTTSLSIPGRLVHLLSTARSSLPA